MKKYTEADIEGYKAKYPNVVREIAVYPSGTTFTEEGEASEDPAYFLVRKPSKNLLALVTSKEYIESPDKANEALVKNCVLDGDMEWMENDASIYMGLITELSKLLQSSKVALKKV